MNGSLDFPIHHRLCCREPDITPKIILLMADSVHFVSGPSRGLLVEDIHCYAVNFLGQWHTEDFQNLQWSPGSKNHSKPKAPIGHEQMASADNLKKHVHVVSSMKKHVHIVSSMKTQRWEFNKLRRDCQLSYVQNSNLQHL